MASFYDGQRALAQRLFERFGVPAIVTHVAVGTRNRIAGTVTAGTTTTANVLAVLGKRKVTSDDGLTIVQSIATINGPAVAGDTLAIGTKSFTIGDFEEVAPDGGQPISYVAVLS